MPKVCRFVAVIPEPIARADACRPDIPAVRRSPHLYGKTYHKQQGLVECSHLLTNQTLGGMYFAPLAPSFGLLH